MTTSANASQSDDWNGESGLRWVANADRRDAVLAPVAAARFDIAAPSPESSVIDIGCGCGCGATTLRASALVGATGTTTGVELSDPMLGVARERAAAAGSRVVFLRADAQTHDFVPASADLVISRFGTMFFSDARAAFTNIGRALRPGGRLCIATWQPFAANDWLSIPSAVLLRHTEAPTTGPDRPGMFTQSDPVVVTDMLEAARFGDISIRPTEVTFTLGASAEAAAGYLADTGPGRLLLESIADGPGRDAALADIRVALADHRTDEGIQLDGGILLVTAGR